MTEPMPPIPSENPTVDTPAEQPVRQRRDVLRDLAWFEITRCVDDDSGPRYMSQDRAMDVIFGQPTQEPREDS